MVWSDGGGLMSKPKGSCKQTGELALCWKIAREVLPFAGVPSPFIIRNASALEKEEVPAGW